MFELSIAKKYLIPKKKQLSVSLISILSIVIISLVVWLVLVFLSVTEGIERSWLAKLTALNAPLRVTPTREYYSSYYYLIDSISSSSNYTLKSIAEKTSSKISNPYLPEIDMEPPPTWPKPALKEDGSTIDLVQTAFGEISHLKKSHTDLFASDFEISGALMRLRLIRPQGGISSDPHQSFLTQVSYLNSFSGKNTQLQSHFIEPTVEDIKHLLYLRASAATGVEDHPEELPPLTTEDIHTKFHSIFDHLDIEQIKISPEAFHLISSLLPENKKIHGYAYLSGEQMRKCFIPQQEKGNGEQVPSLIEGYLVKEKSRLSFVDQKENIYPLDSPESLVIEGDFLANATLKKESIDQALDLNDLKFEISGEIQGVAITGEIPFKGIEITKASIKTHFDEKPSICPPWLYFVKDSEGEYKAILKETMEGANGVILPKNFKDSGVKIGDNGYLSYGTFAASSFQEQRIPISVTGFYDPGVMAIGAKYILAKPNVIHHINLSGNFFSLDNHMNSGIGIWFKDLSLAKKLKGELKEKFQEAGIAPYWKITSFEEYDFAKDLIQQFQSDKYLFSLIGIIILIVACCNIISLLTLLVNDKKKEIGILQSMGAKPISIALIFALCGIFMGLFSCIIGTIAAHFTLTHIDGVAHILSLIQGHEAFNAAFYGNSLPNSLSRDALKFILIATPFISLSAGLIPALKACRLTPTQILRSE